MTYALELLSVWTYSAACGCFGVYYGSDSGCAEVETV